MRMLKCFGVLACCAMLFLALSASANAAPTAIVFGYEGVGGGDTLDDPHSWEAAQNAAYWLDQAGYDATACRNQSAYQLYNQFGKVAVWWFAGHGTGGRIVAQKPSWEQRAWAQPYTPNSPDVPPGTVDHANYYLNNRLGAEVTKTLLAVFQGCNTGDYAAGHSGQRQYHLLRLMREEKFIDAAVGFTESIALRSYGAWAWSFSAWLANDRTLQQAAALALEDVEDLQGQGDGFQSWLISGNQNLVIKPARYGLMNTSW
jgi:hypothetical protein